MAAEIAAAGYPVRFDVEYPEGVSRWMILVRWILAIPQLFVANLLAELAQLLAVELGVCLVERLDSIRERLALDDPHQHVGLPGTSRPGLVDRRDRRVV